MTAPLEERSIERHPRQAPGDQGPEPSSVTEFLRHFGQISLTVTNL